MKKLRQFFINALMLSGVSVLMRTVGVVFQVYLARRVGAEALGLHSLFSSVYGFALTFAGSGLYLATTTLASNALSQSPENASPRPVMQACLAWGLAFGLTSGVLLYTTAPFLSLHFLDEPRAIRPLRIMALTLAPISLSTAVSGYFTSCRRVYKNVVVSVWEQALRIGATVLLLSRQNALTDAEQACIALVTGNVIAEAGSFLLSFVWYLSDRRRYPPENSKKQSLPARLRSLAAVAMPIALSSYVRSALLSVEHALIPVCLRKSGSSRAAALSAYGVLGSMALPVILFPTALLGSFSGLLLPELTECRVKNNQKEISYIAGRVYSFSLWFSVGTAAVLCLFSESFGLVIYQSREAAHFIRLLAPLIPVMYLDNTTDAMLKGLGQQVYSMYVNIADALLSVILVRLMLPTMGIDGYILIIYITELFNTTLSVVRLLTVSHLHPKTVKWVFSPLLCASGATSAVHLTLKLLPPLPVTAPILTCQVCLTLVIYLFLLRGTHAVDKEEVSWLYGMLHRKKVDKSPRKAA